MADWSSMPAELLYSISLRLPISTDVLRFRSVCADWRYAVRPLSPSSTPCVSIKGCDVKVIKRTINILQSTTLPSVSWIVKLEHDNDNNVMHPLHPLYESHKKPLPGCFPKSFCFMNFRVKELSKMFALPTISNSNRVAVLNYSDDGFVLLSIERYKLVVYKSGNYRRKIKDDTVSFYDDVIVKEGKFYAVSNIGTLVLVDHVNMKVRSLADWKGDGIKKLLADCDGELLMVDMCVYMRQHKFKVYRLDENRGEWIRMWEWDLRDRVLFVGDHFAFSASASDIFGVDNFKGNRIIFMDGSRNWRYDDEAWDAFNVGVFDLKSESIEPLGSYPGYSMVFRPPSNGVNP